MGQVTRLLIGVACALALTCPQAVPTLAAAESSASTPAMQDPTEVVHAAALSMLGELDKDRQTYRRDPAKVALLVEKYLLPHFDTEFAARMVLGRHWSVATPEQRQRFIAAFYHSLLTNYASALADFTSDRLQILPARVAPDATRATVHTKVKGSNGMVAVDYELRKTPQGWKAWNVIIEGISYVYSYREDFGSQIESQGIDAVIQRLEAGQKPAARKDSTPTV
jgi:phospholipid transport system substrate-binding protein